MNMEKIEALKEDRQNITIMKGHLIWIAILDMLLCSEQ